MLELSSARKNKVNLSEYDCQRDLENRMLIADLSALEREVLEEILFSPLKFSIKKLARSAGHDEAEVIPVVQKLCAAGLLAITDDGVIVDKEMRKCFEFQMARFEPDFKPDMEFLQAILKKVPIHLLPSWYAVPRTSNSIFESIVEKYLLTPQIYQRYLADLHFNQPAANGIIRDVFSSPKLRISSSDLIAKYNLARADFEEILLLLEFYFVCCLTYEKEEDLWVEYVSPFHEWSQYLSALKETEAPPLPDDAPIVRSGRSDFSFIEDLSALLALSLKSPIGLPAAAASLSMKPAYVESLVQKLRLVQLAETREGYLHALEGASDWLESSLESRALYLYRHPSNRILNPTLAPDIATEKNIREAEKSIKRVLHGKWVYFDDFIKGVIVPLSDRSAVTLKKTGRHWKYTLPTYTEEEKKLIHATLFEWLFEVGVVARGACHGRDCFAATPFGRYFFED